MPTRGVLDSTTMAFFCRETRAGEKRGGSGDGSGGGDGDGFGRTERGQRAVRERGADREALQRETHRRHVEQAFLVELAERFAHVGTSRLDRLHEIVEREADAFALSMGERTEEVETECAS